MMTNRDAEDLVGKILRFSKLPECELSVNQTETVFIRFANNGVTTSGYQLTRQISVTSITDDKRTGNSVITEISDEALRLGVAQSEELAKISRPDPEHVRPLGRQVYPTLNNFDPFTAAARGDLLGQHIASIIESARSRNLSAAGFITRTATSAAIGNKAGLFGYTNYTDSSLSSTMRSQDGSSSGWANQVSTTVKDLDGAKVARISGEKCVTGLRKRRLEPGKYTVILEPAAVSDLLGYFGWGIGAREAEQGQSFLSRKGKAGETVLGDKLFPDYITLRSDPFNPKLSAQPWSSTSLIPNKPVTWIEGGVMKNMYWDRFWAEKAGKEPTPWPSNLALEGQQHTLDDLIRDADRALLVTRFWYIRMLQPQTLQVTGLTRDGVFLVENGKIAGPVMNFRWNESPIRVLQNTRKLTTPIPVIGAEAGSSFAPALLATDFNFASVSDAV